MKKFNQQCILNGANDRSTRIHSESLFLNTIHIHNFSFSFFFFFALTMSATGSSEFTLATTDVDSLAQPLVMMDEDYFMDDASFVVFRVCVQ